MVLEQPNDLLLKPARIRQLTRIMLALGWHPRHIAGLIHSKYARPFGWTQFEGYDRATRADFYTRIFAGLFVTGRDNLVDFNCVSARKRAYVRFPTAASTFSTSNNQHLLEEHMINWRIGLSTGCFCNQNILDCLSLIRESGFDTIEVCSSPTHLDFHDQSAVNVQPNESRTASRAYSFHAPFAPHIDISSTMTGNGAAVNEIPTVEGRAPLNVHYFVIHPGPENPAPVPTEDRLVRIQHVIDSLNQIARRCRELGTTCVLENKLPHLLFGNTSDILWILDGLKGVEVGVCLDTGHASLGGEMH